MARMRGSPTLLLLWASFFVVLLLLMPGSTARALRPAVEGKRLSEKDFKAADDAVPASAKEDYARKYSEWDRFLGEEMTEEYGDTPAAANPSVPCC